MSASTNAYGSAAWQPLLMEKNMIFDTHAHYEDEAFNEDRETMLESLHDGGVGTVVNVASTWRSLELTRALTEAYDFVYGAYGIHPDNVGELSDERLEELERYCRLPKAVAVGEIGLDYYWNKESRELQIKWFREQLRLAKRLGLPVIIHSRDAAEDTMTVSEEEHLEEIGGVVHCYSYSAEMAKKYLKMGMYIGVGGVVTFKNARKLRETVEITPIERIVLETDCPYLSPEPNRGKRNSSLNLPYVAAKIAEIKGIEAEEVVRITEENARRMYRLAVEA